MIVREHRPDNAMADPGEIIAFRDACSPLMGALLDELADHPNTSRAFPEIEDAIGWPRRRISSVLGGVFHLRTTQFQGRRPYHFHDSKFSRSGRWELWVDDVQAAAIREATTATPT